METNFIEYLKGFSKGFLILLISLGFTSGAYAAIDVFNVTSAPSSYVPGTTVTIDFTIEYGTPNLAYLDRVEFTFPAGVTVVGVNGRSPWNGCNGKSLDSSFTASTAIWESPTFPSGCGGFNNGTYSGFEVTVEIDASFCGDMVIAAHADDDGWSYGPHDADTTVTLTGPECASGESCDWRIRVWGNNCTDATWTLTDGAGTTYSGTLNNKVDNYISPVYSLQEPVTFTVDANTSTNYQSVNYYLLRGNAKVEHGRARDEVITHTRNCSDVIFTKPGMDSSLTAFDFSYHPNPVKDVLYINSALDVKEVKVFNIAGQQLLNLNKGLGAQSEINVTTLPEGVYVFRAVLEDGKVETFKVVKR